MMAFWPMLDNIQRLILVSFVQIEAALKHCSDVISYDSAWPVRARIKPKLIAAYFNHFWHFSSAQFWRLACDLRAKMKAELIAAH